MLLGLRFIYEPVSRIMFNVDLFGGGTYFRTRTLTSGSTYETTLKGAAFGAAYAGRFGEKLLFRLGGGLSALSGKWRDVPQLRKPVTTLNPYGSRSPAVAVHWDLNERGKCCTVSM